MQVTLQFAYMVKEILKDGSVFWVPAPSMKSFEHAYPSIARALQIP